MYVYPGPLADQNDPTAHEAWEKKIGDGPILHMSYRGAGASPMDAGMFVEGLAHSFVIAVLSGVMLAMVANAMPFYSQRVVLLLLVSLIASLWTNVGNMIWWGHAPGYTAGQVAYHFVAGLLMSLVTAAIIKPRIPVAVRPA